MTILGNYSCLKVELTFTRDRAFYFTTVFIPGIILVTSSFITFWLEWNAVPARSMIGKRKQKVKREEQISRMLEERWNNLTVVMSLRRYSNAICKYFIIQMSRVVDIYPWNRSETHGVYFNACFMVGVVWVLRDVLEDLFGTFNVIASDLESPSDES